MYETQITLSTLIISVTYTTVLKPNTRLHYCAV